MDKKYRYTGEWPPIEVLRLYPNWEYALDEEDVDGQDETTIRPEAEQTFITEETAFTAAKATQADGNTFDTILDLVGGKVSSIDVLVTDNLCWRLNRVGRNWVPFVQDWLPPEERMLSVSLDDPGVFPLRVATVLPSGPKGRQIEFTVPLATS